MDKQLLDQVKQALASQQETIQAQKEIIYQQEKYLEKKNSDIAQLTASLKALAESQAQQLQALPQMLQDLKKSNKAVVIEYSKLIQAQKEQLPLQQTLAEELIRLSNNQNKLMQTIKSYQNELPPLDSLSATLEALKISQTEIDRSKQNLISTQEQIKSQIAKVNESLQTLQS